MPAPLTLRDFALRVLVVPAALGCTLWLFGAEIAALVAQRVDQLPRAREGLRGMLQRSQLGAMLSGLQEAGPHLEPLLGQLTRLTAATSGALAGLLLGAFGGVYLAANPVRVPGAGGGPPPGG